MSTSPRPLGHHVVLIAGCTALLVAVAVTMFAWPSARLQPRDLPVGIVGNSASSLDRALGAGDGFAVHHYVDVSAARAAIEDRAVYGAFAPDANTVTVYVASAAGPTVTQQLEAVGDQVAAHTGTAAQVVDVVPTSAEDPRGVVLGSAVLPLVLGGEIIGVIVALLIGVRPARHQIVALVAASMTAGAAVYAIAQGWLGALPHEPLATWGVLGLLLFAISSTTAGLFALLGVRGIGAAAATMIFVGNPFSGVTSAPDLLPGPAGWLGRLLPPGAAGTLLRSTAYFDGHGALVPASVLSAWALAGAAAIVIGYHRLPRGSHERAATRGNTVLEPAG
jgi:hypothetical protein